MKNFNILQKKLSILWICTIAFGVASMTFSSCSAQRATQSRDKSIKVRESFEFQEIKKSSNGELGKWVIYSRKIKGSNFLEYKIEGNIESTPKKCVSIFQEDIRNQANDLKNKKYPTYDIVYESTDSLLTYVIHNEPFPLKDTEMSVKYFFSNDEDGSTGASWHEAWDESNIQRSKKLSRVETFRGSWSFVPTSINSSQATNSVRFDPKKMPTWLVKPMVIKFLKNGLEDIRASYSK